MNRILITGASRGIGLAICQSLISKDWQILATARSLSSELKELMDQFPNRIEFYPADLSLKISAQHLATVTGLKKRLDAFVSVAGIADSDLLTLMSRQRIDRLFQVNLLSPLLLAKEAIKGMLGQGGNIVFISSIAARGDLRGLSVYGATKAGLGALARTIARDYGPRGIRCNSVLPGFIESRMTSGIDGSQRARIARRTALRRLGQAVDVAGVVEFLLSEKANYITGSEWVVDGGMTA